MTSNSDQHPGSVGHQAFHRHSFAEVNLGFLKKNFQTLHGLLPQGTFFCPMVKANAYGHGDIKVSKALREVGASHLGVGLIEEGIHLRAAGDSGALLLMGTFERESAEAVFDYGLTPVVSEWSQLESLGDVLAKRKARMKVHLTFNTGMNRLGFDCDQAEPLAHWLARRPEFEVEGVATHLLRGDDAGIPGGESESQLINFAQAAAAFQGFRPRLHALNSSGTLSLWNRIVCKSPLGKGGVWPLGSRPGISIYGIEPSTEEHVHLDLKPVLSLKSQVVMCHRLQPGDRVSYGPTWRAQRPSVIGVVPMGYGDGYFRLFSNRSSVLCRGMRAKVAGSVCMDYFMIDLTDIENQTGRKVDSGEEVVLLGEQFDQSGNRDEIKAQDLADLIGTIPYEILTNITERVPRIYLK